MLETVFPEFHDQLVLFPHRKPNILVIDSVLKSCIVVEVTVCFDLYFGYALDGKCERYEPLCNFFWERNWNFKMVVLCFGSLGCIKKHVWRGMRALSILVNMLQWDYWAGVRFQTSLWRITSGGTELRNYSRLSNFFGWPYWTYWHCMLHAWFNFVYFWCMSSVYCEIELNRMVQVLVQILLLLLLL